MKKKAILLLVTGCMTISMLLAGCSAKSEVQDTVAETQEKDEDFEYLYEEELMTDTKQNRETGEMENQSFSVYVPKADSTSASRDYIYANTMGIYFEVFLNPGYIYEQGVKR